MAYSAIAASFKRMYLMRPVITTLLEVSATWNPVFTTATIADCFEMFYLIIQTAYFIDLYQNVDYWLG